MRWIPCPVDGCQYAANLMTPRRCYIHGGRRKAKGEKPPEPFLVLLSVDLAARPLSRFRVLYAQGDRKGKIAKALARLLQNTDVDLDDCSCAPGDLCVGCSLKKAVR